MAMACSGEKDVCIVTEDCQKVLPGSTAFQVSFGIAKELICRLSTTKSDLSSSESRRCASKGSLLPTPWWRRMKKQIEYNGSSWTEHDVYKSFSFSVPSVQQDYQHFQSVQDIDPQHSMRMLPDLHYNSCCLSMHPFFHRIVLACIDYSRLEHVYVRTTKPMLS